MTELQKPASAFKQSGSVQHFKDSLINMIYPVSKIIILVITNYQAILLILPLNYCWTTFSLFKQFKLVPLFSCLELNMQSPFLCEPSLMCLPQVTMNDVIAAERVFGTLGHIAATETPRCRLLLLLEESRQDLHLNVMHQVLKVYICELQLGAYEYISYCACMCMPVLQRLCINMCVF